jgi:hypothetical protein
MGRMTRTRALVAIALAAHGLIHLIGFVVPWQLATMEGFDYRATALNGAIAIGEGGVRIVGLVWLALAAGFVLAAFGVCRSAPWAVPLVAALALASLIMCIQGLPETAAGIAVNVTILAVVAWLAVRHPATTRVA